MAISEYHIVEVVGDCHLVSLLVNELVVSFFDLLPDGSFIGLNPDVLLCLHQGVDKVVDALIEIGQVLLHVLLLTVRVLILLIRVEVVQLFIIRRILGLLRTTKDIANIHLVTLDVLLILEAL